MQRDTTIDAADDQRAVSPVIGVILMVAITVILAAVIGTFVLNLGGQVQENVQAGASVSFDASNDEITVQYTSNQNADFLNVSISNQSSGDTTYFEMNQVGNKIVNGSGTTTLVGNVEKTAWTGTAAGGSNLATAGAQISDGDSFSVTVTAVKGDTSTVIVSKSDSL